MVFVSKNWKNQDEFERFLVSEYFKLGSINKVFSAHQFNLPISFASYHRILNKFGVIKSAGPNSRLSESLQVLSQLANYKIPLERLYHRHAPESIQVSINTLHRILHHIRLGLTRRQGTVLVITNGKGEYLTGIERNKLTLPMSHSKLGEDPKESILRVLQQEVFTQKVVDEAFPGKIIPNHPKPVLFIDIADIKVSVYQIRLKKDLFFSSFRLSDLKFRSLQEITTQGSRPGVMEILETYEKNSETSQASTPELVSLLNYHLRM